MKNNSMHNLKDKTNLKRRKRQAQPQDLSNLWLLLGAILYPAFKLTVHLYSVSIAKNCSFVHYILCYFASLADFDRVFSLYSTVVMR